MSARDGHICIEQKNKTFEPRRVAYWGNAKEKLHEFTRNNFLIAPDKMITT
ncbi:MAG: hypothetical protein ACFB0B_03505 [Thermonemataceae bacterium]